MIQIGVESEYVIGGSGLTPGQRVELSIEFVPAAGGPNWNSGYSARTVKADGTVRFTVGLDEINPNLEPGHCKAWFRKSPSLWNGDPIGEDAVLEFDVPLTL